MWTKYDETLAAWIVRDDIIKHHGKILTVDYIDDESDPDRIRIVGINEMDDEAEVSVPCTSYVPLVYWQD